MMNGLRVVLLLISLVAALDWVTAVNWQQRGPVPGSPYNVSGDDKGVRQAALVGAYSFNNQSNDAFLFKPSSIVDAQKQIVKGVRYILDVKITRTVCRKREDEDLANCAFQPHGLLHQTIKCHFEVWDIPWHHMIKTIFMLCDS